MDKWISVKDRLPDKYGTYLIVRNGCVMFANRDELLRRPIWNAETYQLSIIPDSEVTHWMPLPELPEEAKEG